jgi:MFS superfamily sulfate permease-like transporter
MSSTTTPISKTALGKTILHALLVAVAYGLTFLVTYFGNIHWPAAFPTYLPGVILIAVIGIKNFVDKTIPNFPTSQQFVAIPQEVAEALHLITVVNADVLPAVDKVVPRTPTIGRVETEAAQVGREAQRVAQAAATAAAAQSPVPGSVVTPPANPNQPK